VAACVRRAVTKLGIIVLTVQYVLASARCQVVTVSCSSSSVHHLPSPSHVCSCLPLGRAATVFSRSHSCSASALVDFSSASRSRSSYPGYCSLQSSTTVVPIALFALAAPTKARPSEAAGRGDRSSISNRSEKRRLPAATSRQIESGHSRSAGLAIGVIAWKHRGQRVL